MSTSGAEKVKVAMLPPHPDDEAIGPCATALQLQAAGAEVIAYLQSLGRPDQHDRRREEFMDSCQRSGFIGLVRAGPARISSKDDLVAAEADLTDTITDFLNDEEPDIIISPSIHDNHHGHEVVARAIRNGIERNGEDTNWWMHATWGHLVDISLYSAFDQDTFDQVTDVLGAYTGENARNDYQKMVRGNADSDVTRGSERISTFGSDRLSPLPYAEVFIEAKFIDGHWHEGEHRLLDPANPLTTGTAGQGASRWIREEWLYKPSPYQIRRNYGA